MYKRGWDSNRGLLAACRGHAATRGGPPAGGESHPVRQKRSPRLVAGASLLEYLEGIRTGAVVNGAPGALQSRDPASAAAEVDSHHPLQKQQLHPSDGAVAFLSGGSRTGAGVNDMPGACQSRDPASAAAEVDSHHPLQEQQLHPSDGAVAFLSGGSPFFLYGVGDASGSGVGSGRLMNIMFKSTSPSIPGTSPSCVYCQMFPA